MQIIKNRLLSSPLHFAGIFLCLYAIAEIFIIIRADVNDSEYMVPNDAFPQLVDLPESGHGTLIASRWVVVAAHSVESESVEEVIINNKPRKVSRVIIHPDFKKSYDQLAENMDGVISLEKTPEQAQTVINAKEAMHDIALIQLAKPVEEVRPVKLLQTADETGLVGVLFGKGATGNGAVGQYEDSQNRQQLRQAQNKIEEARGKWLVYSFDCNDEALATEGVIGRGDSGSPLLIKKNNEWYLAGVASGVKWDGNDISQFRYGVCGQEFYNSRISYYLEWINTVIEEKG